MSFAHRLVPSAILLAAAGLAFAQAPKPAAKPPAAKPDAPPVEHAALRKVLDGKPEGDEAAKLADKVRKWFGEQPLKNGMAAKSDGGVEVAWAVEAEGARNVSAVSVDGAYDQRLQQIGTTGVFAAVDTLSDGTALRFAYQIDGRRIGGGQIEAYTIHNDSLPQPGVPKGKVTQQARWKSQIFAGSERDWWIYVPAQYKPGKPAALMVFQDGGGNYVKQVPVVFDNLIARGDMPVTAGVFINPGAFADGRSNRSFEYDTLSDQYVRFLLEEILPEAEKTVKLRKDPESRAIAGLSSGAICAFTAAWERPDQFRRVLSWVGSFTNIAQGASHREGGHNYSAMIRKVPRKPIRVFLQDGDQDLDNNNGSWPLANRELERSLTFARWDFRIVVAHGFHSPRHGYAILPDSLRWLWRDHKQHP